MQICVSLCLFPWDVTPWEEKAFVSNWGWEAGLGPPHNPFFQVDIVDVSLLLARRVANSSSAQVTPLQLNNFPG